MSRVYRVYVEKKKEYAVEALEILHNLKKELYLDKLTDLAVVNRYDVFGVDEPTLN